MANSVEGKEIKWHCRELRNTKSKKHSYPRQSRDFNHWNVNRLFKIDPYCCFKMFIQFRVMSFAAFHSLLYIFDLPLKLFREEHEGGITPSQGCSWRLFNCTVIYPHIIIISQVFMETHNRETCRQTTLPEWFGLTEPTKSTVVHHVGHLKIWTVSL